MRRTTIYRSLKFCNFLFIFYAEFLLAYTESEQQGKMVPNGLNAEYLSTKNQEQKCSFWLRKGPFSAPSKIILKDLIQDRAPNTSCFEILETHMDDVIHTVSGERIIRRDEIGKFLGNIWPNHQIEVQGPIAVKLLKQQSILSDSHIMTDLKQIFDKFISKSDYRLTVEKVILPTKILIDSNTLKFEFPDLNQENLSSKTWIRDHLSGTQRITLNLISNDESQKKRTISITCSFFLEEKIPVAAKNMTQGEIIGAKDLKLEWKKIHKSSDNFIELQSNIEGKRIKKGISKGEPFKKNNLENSIIIGKGQFANFLMEKNDLSVTVKVQALQAGTYGDYIDAVYPRTKRKLKVRVRDNQTLEFVN